MILTTPFSDGVLKYKALLGLDTLNTHDDSVFRANLKSRFKKAFEKYAWPDFCQIGELVSLTSNLITTNGSTPASGAYLANWADSVMRIQKQDPKSTYNPGEYLYMMESDGYGYPAVRIINPINLTGTNVYVSYKKELEGLIKSLVSPSGTTGFFGSGSGDTNVIPTCVYDYVIYGCYVNNLKADGQNQKAVLEEQYAEKLLQESIDRIENTSRQYRNKIIQDRPRSQFNRHSYAQAGQVVLPGQGGTQ
tara:strand:+ start:1835 stop:2581 length:747 start_codon:yes stop_codon:yes gene_type:complete